MKNRDKEEDVMTSLPLLKGLYVHHPCGRKRTCTPDRAGFLFKDDLIQEPPPKL